MRRAKKLREEANLTQGDVARHLRVDRSAIAHFERGGGMLMRNLQAFALLLSERLKKPMAMEDLMALEESEEAPIG